MSSHVKEGIFAGHYGIILSYFVPIVRIKLMAPTMNNTPRPTRVDTDIQTSARGRNASLQ